MSYKYVICFGEDEQRLANLSQGSCIYSKGDNVCNIFLSTCSVAVMFLREMTLPCTEQQMEALTNCLARAEAFGPVSAWGPEIFTEIGTLAGTVEHRIPQGANFLCTNFSNSFIFKEQEGLQLEMAALGRIGPIKTIPEA